jgi:hypothetical protein
MSIKDVQELNVATKSQSSFLAIRQLKNLPAAVSSTSSSQSLQISVASSPSSICVWRHLLPLRADHSATENPTRSMQI